MITTVRSPAEVRRSRRPESTRDDVIRAAVRAALRKSGYRCISQLDVDVFEGTVVLKGAVPSFYIKQMAQETVLKLGTVPRVENMVEVERR